MREPVRTTRISPPPLSVLAALALSLPLFLGARVRAGNRSWDARQLSAPFEGAPLRARNLANPYAGQSDAVRAGAKLFSEHCASCHGQDARGQGGAPPLRSSVIQETPSGVLFWFLRNGNLRRGMPSWSGLPDQQRWQLVSYLKTRR